MGFFQRASAVVLYFVWAVALAVLYSSIVRLQPAPLPPSPPLLTNLLGVHFQPLSRISAFLLTNALVLAFLLLPRGRYQPPPSAPLPHDAHLGEAQPDDSFPEPPLEEDVSYEDEAVLGTESSLTASHAPAAATWGAPSSPLSRRSTTREELAPAAATWEGPWQGQLQWSEPDAGALWETPAEEDEEDAEFLEEEAEEEEVEVEVRDEFRERIEAFIGRQMRFMWGEEVMLTMVTAGGP